MAVLYKTMSQASEGEQNSAFSSPETSNPEHLFSSRSDNVLLIYINIFQNSFQPMCTGESRKLTDSFLVGGMWGDRPLRGRGLGELIG